MIISNRLYIITLVSFLIASCTTYKDITYLRNLNPKTADSLYLTKVKDYKIQPADILYIKVNCMDENINEVFNKSTLSSSLVSSNLGGFYVIGYTVEPDGNIILPVLGKIFVSGLTIQEALSAIQKQADKYIANAQIDIKLVSFKFSVLGEVKRPGQYNIFNDKANVFEALAIAGDLTYYANRKNVLILRSGPEGIKTYRINLTDKDILATQLFYLQPNDIVYVEPMKSTGLRLSAADYSVLISTISVTLTTYFLIRNITK
jgi:Periplasmic protein involved in polysaccharide export